MRRPREDYVPPPLLAVEPLPHSDAALRRRLLATAALLIVLGVLAVTRHSLIATAPQDPGVAGAASPYDSAGT